MCNKERARFRQRPLRITGHLTFDFASERAIEQVIFILLSPTPLVLSLKLWTLWCFHHSLSGLDREGYTHTHTHTRTQYTRSSNAAHVLPMS